MNVLVDAQLPRRLYRVLDRAGHRAIHTLDLPHQNETEDRHTMHYADTHDCIVMTKDADFVDAFYLQQTPRKIWLISTGNIRNADLEHLIGANVSQVVTLFATHYFIELSRTDIIVHVECLYGAANRVLHTTLLSFRNTGSLRDGESLFVEWNRSMLIARTERLLVRHLHPLDHAALCRVFGDPQVMRFGDGVQSPEWVSRWILQGLEEYRQRGFGPYAVLDRRSGEVIGYCGLFFFPDVNGQPEIELGYRLSRARWGCGYATEAARAVRDFAFETLGVQRLIAMIDPDNSASIGVAIKLGMRYEREVLFPGYSHPDHVYVITAS